MFSIQPRKENEIGYRVVTSCGDGYYNIPNKKLAALMANTLNRHPESEDDELAEILFDKRIVWDEARERWTRSPSTSSRKKIEDL